MMNEQRSFSDKIENEGVKILLPYKNSKIKVTSPFGERNLNGAREFHGGVDLVGVDSKEIISVCNGVIGVSTMFDRTVDTTDTWQWGNYVRVDGFDGRRYYYCHMSKRLAVAGREVKAGDVIGIEGNTGYSFGSHLHFEIRENGKAIDPCKILGIENKVGSVTPMKNATYADLVCMKCGFEQKTRDYICKYRFASDLWRKLWEAMRE